MTYDDFKLIISQAIKNELEAYAFYRNVHNKIADKEMKNLFAELASEEEKHKETLEEMLKKGPSEMRFSETHDYKITDEMPLPPLSTDLKPTDGLVIAIKKELEAVQMYTQLANACEDEEQKKIFKQLVEMEKGHKSRLEDIYTDMAFPERW